MTAEARHVGRAARCLPVRRGLALRRGAPAVQWEHGDANLNRPAGLQRGLDPCGGPRRGPHLQPRGARGRRRFDRRDAEVLAGRDDIRVISHAANRGYGAALRSAFGFAVGGGTTSW